MTSKRLWIIGGCLIVAIGAVAYMTNNSAPAGQDAAGTLAEANRAHADVPAPSADAATSATVTRSRPAANVRIGSSHTSAS